jgi:hypothetical protein
MGGQRTRDGLTSPPDAVRRCRGGYGESPSASDGTSTRHEGSAPCRAPCDTASTTSTPRRHAPAAKIREFICTLQQTGSYFCACDVSSGP